MGNSQEGPTKNYTMTPEPRKVEEPKLPYEMDALEPYISKKTLEFHFGKHHKGYYKKLIRQISGDD